MGQGIKVESFCIVGKITNKSTATIYTDGAAH